MSILKGSVWRFCRSWCRKQTLYFQSMFTLLFVCLFVFPCCEAPVFCHCRMVLDPKNSNHNDYGSIQSHGNHSQRHLHHAIDIPGEAHQSCSDDTGLHSDNESVRLTHDMTQSDLYQRQVCISLDLQNVLITMLTHCTTLHDPERTSFLCMN